MAIVVKGSNFKVVGEGSVKIVDVGGMSHADLVYRRDKQPISMIDVRLQKARAA